MLTYSGAYTSYGWSRHSFNERICIATGTYLLTVKPERILIGWQQTVLVESMKKLVSCIRQLSHTVRQTDTTSSAYWTVQSYYKVSRNMPASNKHRHKTSLHTCTYQLCQWTSHKLTKPAHCYCLFFICNYFIRTKWSNISLVTVSTGIQLG